MTAVQLTKYSCIIHSSFILGVSLVKIKINHYITCFFIKQTETEIILKSSEKKKKTKQRNKKQNLGGREMNYSNRNVKTIKKNFKDMNSS